MSPPCEGDPSAGTGYCKGTEFHHPVYVYDDNGEPVRRYDNPGEPLDADRKSYILSGVRLLQRLGRVFRLP